MRRSSVSWRRLAGWRIAGLLACFTVVSGCALLRPLPEPTTLDQRLAAFPTDGHDVNHPVEIRWNKHQVPYILAESDADAAYALGLVQAHLRLSQLEMGRRVAQGRMSEMFGPTFRGLDHTIRAIGMGRSAEASLEMMPEESRVWLQRFTDGVNHYQASLQSLPYEYALMDMKREPWTPADMLMIGRLGSIDFNWAHYATLLSKRKRPDWPEVWTRALRDGMDNPVSFKSHKRHAELKKAADKLFAFIGAVKRSGSNSYVISGDRAKKGAAMIASDPHLGYYLPNLWLIVGLWTPTQHVVGFVPPAVPLFAMGRNKDIAWGGTNLYAASSDLVDVSDLPADEFSTEKHTIKSRFWFSRDVENRITPYGPVVTDVEFVRKSFDLDEGDAYALRWVGHLPSDEVTALLDVARAENFEEFRGAFKNFALPGQNMMYADKDGNIGHVIATQLPHRPPGTPKDIVVTPAAYNATWSDMVSSLELPWAYNPSKGFLASANNKPANSVVPVGFFFALPDRILRLNELLSDAHQMTVADLAKLQRDVYSARAFDIKDRLVRRLEHDGGFATKGEARKAWTAIKQWNGYYYARSHGALAVEAFFDAIAPGLADATGRRDQYEDIVEAGGLRRLVDDAMAEVNDTVLRRLARDAIEDTAVVLRSHRTWGAIHRLRLSHPMANVPIIGSKFRFVDLPGPGSSETLMKTAHVPTTSVHEAEYGSQARHISDMSDPDANYFVVAGGQDGWMNSSTFVDQVELWRKAEYIRMPLSEDLIKREFPYVTRILPDH